MLSKHLIAYVRVFFYYLFVINSVADRSLFDVMDNILDNEEPYKVSHLNIDGNDLMGLGFEGPEIKIAREKALLSVINEETENTKEALIEFLKN